MLTVKTSVADPVPLQNVNVLYIRSIFSGHYYE